MMAFRADVPLYCPSQADLDWLVREGVSTTAMVRPWAMTIATGRMAPDGLFEHVENGERWFAFEEANDFVFWHPRNNEFSTYGNIAFALGEAMIDNPATYSFDCNLNIFADPLEWLRANRDGIVVLPQRWPFAFDRLRDAPRIAIAEHLLPLYRRHMKPAHLPELSVIPARRFAA